MAISFFISSFKGIQSSHKNNSCWVRGFGEGIAILFLVVFLSSPALAIPPQNDSATGASQGLSKKIAGLDGTPMVLIPAGEFLMGNIIKGEWRAKPAHPVNLAAYYMDLYEVTNSRYAAFLKATGRKKPRSWNQVGIPKVGKRPVVGISWYDAQAYCQYHDKRLPTEAEWEKAARGTDGRIYPWGNKRPSGTWSRYMYIGKKRYLSGRARGPSPVGGFKHGRSPYGVYDLGGNVAEWVADWFASGYDQDSPRKNPKGPSNGKSKVIRGGSSPVAAGLARSFDRFSCPPEAHFPTVGFRCAKDAY